MIALVTGASSGLGIEFSKLLAKNGFDLILCARRENRLKIIKKLLEKKYNVKVEYFVTDLSNLSELEDFANKCFNKKIHILINNAGFGVLGNFWEIDRKEHIDLINTNITALTYLCHTYINTQNSGYILNVASIAGFMPGPLLSAYYASKAYVLNLSNSINEELKHSNKDISVTAICPGSMNTEFFTRAGASKMFTTSNPHSCAKIALTYTFNKRPIAFSDPIMHIASFFVKFLPRTIITKATYIVQRLEFLS